MTSELLVEDAAYSASKSASTVLPFLGANSIPLPRALEDVAARRGLQGLVCLTGNAVEIGVPAVWAADERRDRALWGWVGEWGRQIADRPDLRGRLGAGTTLLVGLEADGTVRVVTSCAEEVDIPGMVGWADAAVFDGALTHLPFATHFGTGNGGVPVPLREESLRVLREELPQHLREAWLDEPPATAAA